MELAGDGDLKHHIEDKRKSPRSDITEVTESVLESISQKWIRNDLLVFSRTFSEIILDNLLQRAEHLNVSSHSSGS